MIAGRKLLLADDSIAIQKVIDLTFTDEGMEVTTVGDGQDALEKLNNFTPDVVLADVYMPGVDGYKLCQFIKQNERFRGVPVMLLVGSFEPFDEAEASRVGADDVVTKPFQSIRDLVRRVGSLMRGESTEGDHSINNNSMLNQPDERPSVDDNFEGAAPAVVSADNAESAEQQHVKVFVEAPMMESSEATTAQEHHCPPDIEVQTADTQQLEPVYSATVTTGRGEFEDTVEVELVEEAEGTRSEATSFEDDGVLDLGDIDSVAAATAEDEFELDIDVEPLPAYSLAGLSETGSTVESRDTQATFEPPVSGPVAGGERKEQSTGGLSREAIEAISRRVVEQLSDEVVREIAWEVVPELSELLIKKRLEQPE